jgi:diguanylate cyclase (GGDEF)-like protein/PAS domain S-box-containing protein
LEVNDGKIVSINGKIDYKDKIRGKKFDDIFINIDDDVYEVLIDSKKYYFKVYKNSGDYYLCDITHEYKVSKILQILQNCADVLINAKNEDEIIDELIKTISLYVSFVCFIKKEENFKLLQCSKKIKKETSNKIEDYLNSSDENCPVKKAINENRIIIIKNIKDNDGLSEEIKNNFKKAGINYLLILPVFKHSKPLGVLLIASKFSNEFVEEIYYFDKLKKLVEFTLEKLEMLSFLTLIKEAIDKEYSWIVITDENANVLYANDAVEKISGYEVKELLGKNPKIFKSGLHSKGFYKNLWKKLTNNEIFEGVFINKKKNGELFYLKDKIVPVKTPDNKQYYISIATDISNEFMLKKKLKKIQNTDSLTGLLNRNGFIDTLNEKTDPAKTYAMIVVDVKDFKMINQIFSRETGDDFLLKIANTLNVHFKSSVIARVGADDFAVFFEYKELDELYKKIEEIIEEFKKIDLNGIDLSINIGIALYPKDDIDFAQLLEKAFIALENARKKGEFEFDFYNHETYEKLLNYQKGRIIVADALKNDKFIYYLQPYIDANTNEIIGAESLLRIKDKDRIITPFEFIDYAEKSGKIKEIEKKMLPKYLEMVKTLKIPISFNISGKSINDKKHIIELFRNIEDIPMIIEITERELASNIKYTLNLIGYFKSKHLKISIDDFGTGYSSLTYLKDIPADYLKIDMSFVRNIENSSKDLAIVETIINFAHKLGMKTIAEGVETQTQVDILKALKCDYLQGYYFYKPMPYEEFKKILNK